jgi:hypothetical protein
MVAGAHWGNNVVCNRFLFCHLAILPPCRDEARACGAEAHVELRVAAAQVLYEECLPLSASHVISLASIVSILQFFVGFVWNIVIDATSSSMTKTSKNIIKDSILNFMVLKTITEPALSSSIFLSVTSLLPGGATVCAVLLQDMTHRVS